MESLYISRVIIKNFRNFENIDVSLTHKQVIIGENNVGKTNFLRAIQLILDQSFSDEDRYLEESDFFDGIEEPMINGTEIEISVFINNYKHNKSILAQLADATVKCDDEEVLKITYKYYPEHKENGDIEYKYIIFKGNNENKGFTHEDRKYLNIRAIKAIRDVENEMKNQRTSPINKLVKTYGLRKEDLSDIAQKLKDSGADVLSLDEMIDLEKNINNRFKSILGAENNFDIALKTIDVDPSRILNSLNLLISNRNTSNISLGVNNILYISLILLLLQDKTIPTFVKKTKFEEFLEYDENDILEKTYKENENGNYFLKDNLSNENIIELYEFMDEHDPKCEGVTILAIEEPEAHLHPIYQRLIYKDVIRKNGNSVILTTHSTHITAVAPIDSIVHLYKNGLSATRVLSTASINLSDVEKLDIERYVDVKRGEIYFGKGIILVEGIAEEYLVPRFAELLDKPLDEKGIIICNVNSTNFKPYVKLLRQLQIPYTVITDGDFYYEIKSDKGEITKDYHIMHNKSDKRKFGYLGIENITNLVTELEICDVDSIPEKFNEVDKFFNELGFFIGNYTLEVDIMDECHAQSPSKKIICETFNNLTEGGKKQKQNFKEELEGREFWKCLSKIEANGIGKGRFAQMFSTVCNKKHIPNYISSAIDYIYEKVE